MNKQLRLRLFFFLLLLVLLMACKAQAAGPAASPEVNVVTAVPTTKPTTTTAPTVTAVAPTTTAVSPTAMPPTPTATPFAPEQVGEFYILPDGPLPPTDYTSALLERVAAGEVELGAGIVTALDFLLGDAAAAAVFGPIPPSTDEAHGLVALADEYLATGEDDAVQAAITARLARLRPSVAQLLPYAQPQPDTSSVLPKVDAHLSKPTAQDIDCEDLFAAGFPEGSDQTCILYTEATLVNGTARLYYPETWWPADDKLQFVLAATGAVVHSMEVFSQFGRTGSVDLIFSTLPVQSGSTTVMGETPYRPDEESCLIVIYPLGVQNGQAKGMDQFQQLVAHESFHCFQAWNMPADQHPYFKANRWWIEGSAEYFSNVAYPEANAEWKFVLPFDMNSAKTPLYMMGYENTVFFQYLANVLGNQAVVDLLASFPPSSNSQDTLNVLAAYPNMQTIFHGFGRAWADGAIYDTSGEALQNWRLVEADNQHDINSDFDIYASTTPFFLYRSLLRYTEGKTYANSISEAGAAGLYAGRPDGGEGYWSSLPELLGAGCGQEHYLLVLTNASAGTEAYKVDVDITTTPDPTCDKCLVGDWKLDVPTYFDSFQRTLMQDATMQLTPVELSGSFNVSFSEGGIYFGDYDQLLLRWLVTIGGRSSEMGAYYDGQGLASYFTDGRSLTLQPGISTAATQMFSSGGLGPKHSIDAVGFGITDGANYTCTDNTLHIEKADPLTGLPLIYEYTRVKR